MLRLGCLCLSAALLVATASAEEPEALEDLLGPLAQKYDVPALGGAIVSQGRLVAVGAVGIRKFGEEAPVSRDDLWHLGSCTKSMTATLIGRLVEKEQLRFDLTLAEAFPELKETMDPGWRECTLAQLLSNRGGAPRSLDADGLWKRLWKHPGPPEKHRRTLVESLLSRPPAATPGSKYIYSNGGFSLAGAVAERVTGIPYEKLMEQEVFTPLGMTSAGWGAPGVRADLNQPWGHRAGTAEADPKPRFSDNPPGISPAGRVHASLADWARYAAVHLGHQPAGEGPFLKPETLTTLHTVYPGGGSRYAMGWAVAQRSWGGGRVLTHNGSNNLWYAVVWLAPKRDFAVLVTCNLGGKGAARACDRTAWALIQHHLGMDKEKAEGED